MSMCPMTPASPALDEEALRLAHRLKECAGRGRGASLTLMDRNQFHLLKTRADAVALQARLEARCVEADREAHPDGRARLRWIVIADEWREIYFAAGAEVEHELPAPEEIVEWLRSISIQCPECEQPEGEWKTLE